MKHQLVSSNELYVMVWALLLLLSLNWLARSDLEDRVEVLETTIELAREADPKEPE